MSDEKDKPEFDEQALARLLEAAYVLQEHNRRLQEMERLEPRLELTAPEVPAPPAPLGDDASEQKPAPDYTFTLGQIVEIQRQIQVHHLELADAMTLIATRVTEIGKASGSSIGILENKEVRYQASSGETSLPAGTNVPMEKALCVASLRTGQVVRCPDVNTEFLLDADECRRRGIQSLIAVPIYHDGGIAGGIELYYSRPQAFGEQDVHTCQLMAGLVTEALARDEELTWKKSLAAERAVMMQALERVRGASGATTAPAFLCTNCGNGLMHEEQFCGKCGTPRRPDTPKPPVAVDVHPSSNSSNSEEEVTPELLIPNSVPTTPDEIDEIDDPLSDFLAPVPAPPDSELALTVHTGAEGQSGSTDLAKTEEEEATVEGALVRRTPDWSSAVAAREYLEQMVNVPPGGFARFWQARRGDIYLAIAVIFVACVIRWGIWSDHSVTAGNQPTATASHRRPAPDADLSVFDRMLIKLGLAEAPEPMEYKGNPDTQVWVDLQTALYYCPGTDLYGKTPKGKFSSQKEAQLDAFEPALRKACN